MSGHQVGLRPLGHPAWPGDESQRLVDITNVGKLATSLVSNTARHITAASIPADGGQQLLA